MDSDGLVILPKMNVSLRQSGNINFKGNLCFSKHYMMIYHQQYRKNDFSMLIKAIDTVKILNVESIVEIRTKDFKIYTLELLDDGNKNTQTLLFALDFAIRNNTVVETFPFVYKPEFNVIEDGWTAFMLKEEFTEVLINGNWGLVANEVCSTYDKTVIVPIETTLQNVIESSRIHTKERFPVLAFFYKASQSSLMRCSQYTSSLEKMASIDPIIKTLKCSYCFVDLRSKTLIKSVPLEGRILKNATCPTEKLEVLLSSFQKFIEVCQEPHDTPVDRFLSKLESSQWLDMVRQMLRVSSSLAHALCSKQCNYVVIGDTGCDYELLVSSLVQVVLMPDARTLRGFEALIDREWIQAGHPFWDRCRRISGNTRSSTNEASNNMESPVFLLFLDCVWQIMQFNPTSFEFNELLLKSLAHHAYFSEFGTFLGNCPEDRESYSIPSKTTSLWSYLNQHDVMMDLMNHLYDPTGKESLDSICWPPIQPQYIQIWRELYSGNGVSNIDLLREQQKDTVQKYKLLKIQNQQLRKILTSLENELEKTDLFVARP